MVALLYALIALPILGWIIAFGYETSLAFGDTSAAEHEQAMPYVHATWEVTHTLLVYSFTVFMISHADALPILDGALFLPVCVFMLSLIVRGCLYLYLFYGDSKNPKALWHHLFALSHMVMLVAVLSGAIGTFLNLRLYPFTPDTENIVTVAIGFVLTSGLCALPIYAAYRHKD